MIVLLTILTADIGTSTTSTFISILRLFLSWYSVLLNNSQCKLRPYGLPWFLVQFRRTCWFPIPICLGELHPHQGWVGGGKRIQDGCISTHWSKHWSSFLSLQTGLQGQEKATPHINMIAEGIGGKRGKECYGFQLQMFSLTLMSLYNDKRVNSLKTYTGMWG